VPPTGTNGHPSVGSGASQPTPTRIVLFKGGGDASPVGPKVQPAGHTLFTKPVKITTTNDGKLVEDTSLGPIGTCTARCGEWWYEPTPTSWVQLDEFHWDQKKGPQVLGTNLVPALTNNNEWAYLGNGTRPWACRGSPGTRRTTSS
jgi:hypothetical protein